MNDDKALPPNDLLDLLDIVDLADPEMEAIDYEILRIAETQQDDFMLAANRFCEQRWKELFVCEAGKMASASAKTGESIEKIRRHLKMLDEVSTEHASETIPQITPSDQAESNDDEEEGLPRKTMRVVR